MVELADKYKQKRNFLETLDAYCVPASEPTGFSQRTSEPTGFSQRIHPRYLEPRKLTVQSYVMEQISTTNWALVEYVGWRLPATSEPHPWCGKWQCKGCLDVNNHQKHGLGNTVYVRQYKSSCYRPKCSTCYLQWIKRQANRSTRRIERYQKLSKRKVFHIVISVSEQDRHLPYKIMKKKLGRILRDLDVYGGAVVFHPFRLKRPRKEWYFSPHFHLVGFGQISGRVGYVAKKYGWFIKYLKERRSVFQTFCYLLSHCGIKKGYRGLIWMGALSYGKLKLEKEPESNLCPCCKVKLAPVFQYGVDPVVPPDQYFEGFVDSEGWYLVKTGTDSSDGFRYSSIKDVENILESITNAC